jgi:uncharacterized repeat protein (TIGR02543 family)
MQSAPRSHSLTLLVLLAHLLGAFMFSAHGQLTAQEQAIADRLISHGDQGRAFLQLDPILTRVARERAADMARRNYFGHVNPDGHGPNYLVEQAGYPLPDWWGNDARANYIESIAAGRSSASATWDDWMNSPSHRQHLLATDSFSKNQTSYGIGYAFSAGSTYGHYWVVITAPPRPTPQLSIASPAANQRVNVPQVAVSGTTGGSTAAQLVQFRVENSAGSGAFQTASGTASWSGVAPGLVPGPNTIRVRSLSATNAVLAEATRVVIYTIVRPLTVSISGEGSVTTGFLGTTNREVGRAYTIVATPAVGWLFAGWTGASTSTNPTLAFTMREGLALTANFVPNPFFPLRGAYRGLVQGSDSGLLLVTLGANGAFTGRLVLEGRTYPLAGRFSLSGAAAITIPRGTLLPPLTLSLRLDLAGPSGISATVSDGSGTSSAVASASYRAAAGRFAKAGRYTIALPANLDTTDPDAPRGDGYATLVVDATARATFSGVLADGRPFTAAGFLSGDATFEFHVPLFGGAGSVAGRFALRETAVSDLDGTFHWSKPERLADRFHPGAFETDHAIVGSRYVAPPMGKPVLAVAATENNSRLTLADGDLEPAVVQSVTLDPTNRVRLGSPALPGLRVGINAAAGTFSGSFVHPATGVASRIRGVIFQKQNAGFGFFLGEDESGSTALMPAQ